MKVTPISTNSPSFGWGINVRFAKHGKTVAKITEYKPDNGFMVIRMDEYFNGKRRCTLKELYNKKMRLIRRKAYEYDQNGKRVSKEFLI